MILWNSLLKRSIRNVSTRTLLLNRFSLFATRKKVSTTLDPFRLSWIQLYTSWWMWRKIIVFSNLSFARVIFKQVFTCETGFLFIIYASTEDTFLDYLCIFIFICIDVSVYQFFIKYFTYL